jgi:hypothetical protein
MLLMFCQCQELTVPLVHIYLKSRGGWVQRVPQATCRRVAVDLARLQSS